MAHHTRRMVPPLEIAKQDNESRLDHHKRIIYGKLVDKTLSDVDYAELSEVVYGQQFSSDVARRMFYGSKRTLDLVEEESARQIGHTAARSVIEELEEKRVEIQKERQRLSDQRREYNKGIASDARFEHLCDIIRASSDKLRPIDCMISQDKIFDTYTSDSEAVLVFSDWHMGMVANNVFNTYNTEVCEQRVSHVVEEASKRIRLNACKRLHVVVLGDLIHGNCHVSARVASEEVAVEQLMHATELLAQAIATLNRCVEETYVYVTYGNHARAVANKSDSIHRDNLERFSGWWLVQRFASDESITVVDCNTNEFLFINACGHDICASHGDLDSVRTSPRLLPTLFNKKYGKNVEYILIGDKHHRESFEELGVTAMICGSLCGTDDYANDKRLYSEPSQLLLIVTPEDGVDAEYRLRCK